jgi:4-hydroxybenzoate polyprenyltransferase
MSYHLSGYLFIVVLAYFLLQMAYSFYLKHIVILDIFALASGFLLRVIAGAVVINVEISSWLLICTILLSLFLGLSKRRYELVVIGENAQNHRKVLGEYSPYLLDQMISVVTASTVVAYSLYTMSDETIEKFGTKHLIFTIPFVLYGIFRYLYLIHKKEAGGNPENTLVTDRPLMIAVLLWAVTVGIILYQ